MRVTHRWLAGVAAVAAIALAGCSGGDAEQTTPLSGDIREAHRAARFEEELSSEHMPPISQYRLGGEDAGFYAEFLVPLRGDGRRRDGTPDATLKKAGITAQKLRYMDLLLVHPWTVHLGTPVNVPLDPSAEVSIANPVSFIAQKLLIRKHRPPDKQAQDALYVHDTLELFGRELDVLNGLWRESVRPSLPEKTARSVEELWREQFGVVDPVIQSAARIPRDRTLRPDRMQQLCAYGLERIFGPPADDGPAA